jgi:hypothetical protein
MCVLQALCLITVYQSTVAVILQVYIACYTGSLGNYIRCKPCIGFLAAISLVQPKYH